MKFNKQLDKIITKYKYIIPPEHWFEYKKVKKLLKDATKVIKFSLQYNPYQNNQNDDDCCCICLENNKLMRTFCCKNLIHHICLMQVLTSPVSSCPICRSHILKVLCHDINNPKNVFDAKILSLVSTIQLNINKIEQVSNSKIIKNPQLHDLYRKNNYLAVVKICKKIEKQLHINIKDYFISVMKKNNILTNEIQNKQYNYCHAMYILFKKAIS